MSQTVYPHSCRYGWKLLSKGPELRGSRSMSTRKSIPQYLRWRTGGLWLHVLSVRSFIIGGDGDPQDLFFHSLPFILIVRGIMWNEYVYSCPCGFMARVCTIPSTAIFPQSKSRADRVMPVLAKHMPHITRFWTISTKSHPLCGLFWPITVQLAWKF